MNDYVLREDVLRRVEEDGHDNELDLGYPDHNEAFQEIIKAIPAADVVEVRKGRWIQHYVGQERTPWGSDCSVCGEWLVIDRLVMQEKYHYCPNCGAKMDV